MIAYIHGELIALGSDHVVVLTSGGIGYKVYVPFTSITAGIGDTIELHTLMIVRQESVGLYGFASVDERSLFEQLLTVNGVGPRSALAILSTLSVDRLRSAVASGQTEALTRVPGIGKKTAERILMELKDRLKGADGLIAAAAGVSDTNKDVFDALLSLGYSAAEAQAALHSIPLDTPDDFGERMRRALAYFVSS